MPRFRPLFRNPYAATIAGHCWPRRLDVRRFPVEARLFTPEAGVQVLVHGQQPAGAVAQAVLVHGLEGSSLAGYMRSMAQALLEAGCAAWRFNLRSCGGTEFLCRTLYHAGLTSDLLAFLEHLHAGGRAPVHLVGFSLGGNVALKLAGELGHGAARLLASVTAVSAPLDLGTCVSRLGEPCNRLFEWRFVSSMKRRLRMRRKILPATIPWNELAGIRTLYEIDDRVTAPSFGFRSAAHYYETQSAVRFLAGIAVPTLLVQAKDDPMIPFSVYSHPGVRENPRIRLLATDHGGHMGFISSNFPRFWADQAVREWILGSRNN